MPKDQNQLRHRYTPYCKDSWHLLVRYVPKVPPLGQIETE